MVDVIARSAATKQSPPDADHGQDEIASLPLAMTFQPWIMSNVRD
jgi:hypothetical protein